MPVPITLDRFIRFPVASIPECVLNEILEPAWHEDPAWIRDKVMGKPVSEDDHYIYSYRYTEDESTVYMARGLRAHVLDTLSRNHLKFEITDRRVDFSPINVKLKKSIVPFKYQDKAITALLEEDEGLLDASCGAGKTIMSFMLVARIKQPTLVVVGTPELLNQWIKEAKEKTNLRKIGRIGDGSFDVRDVTVSTFQTLNNLTNEQWKDLNHRFGCLIFDECHHAAAPTINSIANRSAARRRYGVTATVKRKDKMEFLVYDALGHRIVKIEEEELEAEGRLVSAQVEFIPYEPKVMLSKKRIFDRRGNPIEGKYEINWGRAYTELAEDKNRNALIVMNIAKTIRMGHFPLVISPRVAQVEAIFEALAKMGFDAGLLVGKVKKIQRKDLIKRANTSQLEVLCASNNIAAEGMDVPDLSCVHILLPTSNPNFIKQVVGRTRRVVEGKLLPLVQDYVDKGNPILFGMGRTREKHYTKLGFSFINTMESIGYVVSKIRK